MHFDFAETLKYHLSLYPMMQCEDIVKLAYQCAFGASHFSGSVEDSVISIKAELHTCTKVSSSSAEKREIIDVGSAVRFDINSPLSESIGPEILGKFFFFSSQNSAYPGTDYFMKCISSASDFVSDKSQLSDLAKDALISCPSHSKIFKEKYDPHYRIISKKYSRALNAVMNIKKKSDSEKRPLTIAIDGPCASGKSTIANILAYVFDAEIIKTDDFFLPPQKRNSERLSSPGGNIDSERFYNEVCSGIISGKDFTYDAFSCFDLSYTKKDIKHEKNIIVEGSYSMLPEFRSIYDICIFSDVSREVQTERLKKRNPEKLERFLNEWIPLENKYFDFFNIKKNADIIMPEN